MSEPERVADPLTVLYVAGSARSGTTLLGRLLGQLPGFVAVGELRRLWDQGLVHNRKCGCGIPFRECPFWQRVGHEAFGGWESLDLERILGLHRSLDRASAFPSLRRPRLRSAFGARLAEYRDLLGEVLRAIREVSGAQVIVDSSKSPAHALILRQVHGTDIRVVHLVRDARAVVFSRQRPRTLPARKKPGHRMGTVSASTRWLVSNAMASRLSSSGLRYTRLRYEDLAREPVESVRAVLEDAGVGDDSSTDDLMDGARVVLETDHMIWGSNRVRFTTGEIAIRLDDEWRRSMRRVNRRVVSALTAPLLRRYGYFDGSELPPPGPSEPLGRTHLR